MILESEHMLGKTMTACVIGMMIFASLIPLSMIDNSEINCDSRTELNVDFIDLVNCENRLVKYREYIRNNYHHYGDIIHLESKNIRETGISYDILTMQNVKEDGRLEYETISVNIQTGKIEVGTNQITKDETEYINNLPIPYQKFNENLRIKIVDCFGHLPPIEAIENRNNAYTNRIFSVGLKIDMAYENTFLSFVEKNNFETMFISSDTNFNYVFYRIQLTLPQIIDFTKYDYVKLIRLSYDVREMMCMNESVAHVGGLEAQDMGYGGTNVLVGILDEAIIDSPTDLVHPAIRRGESDISGLIDFEDFEGKGTTNEHGIMIAGILGSDGINQADEFTEYIGMAPQISLANAAVFGEMDDVTMPVWQEGLNWLVSPDEDTSIAPSFERHSADVVTFSLALDPLNDDAPLSNGNSFISSYFDFISYTEGTPICCAAGNFGDPDSWPSCTGITIVPADAYNVITVGATSEDFTAVGSRSSYSNMIDDRCMVNMVAPGSYITSCNSDWKDSEDWKEGLDSSTSYATPHVAAITASVNKMLRFYSSHAGIDPVNHGLITRAILMNSANKLDDWDNGPTDHPLDTKQGTGQLDAVSAVEALAHYEDDDLQWDWINLEEEDSNYLYHFYIPETTDFSATATWNRHVMDPDDPPDINQVFMTLYDIDHSQEMSVDLQKSVSLLDNFQHIYYPDISPGHYAIEIEPYDLTKAGDDLGELIAVAFDCPSFANGEQIYLDDVPGELPEDADPSINIGSPTCTPEPDGNNDFYVTRPGLTINAELINNGDFDLGSATWEIVHESGLRRGTRDISFLSYDNDGVFGNDPDEVIEIPPYVFNVGENTVELYVYTTEYTTTGKYAFNNDIIIKIDWEEPSPPPDLISPESWSHTTDRTPKFDWHTSYDSISDMDYYELVIDDDSDFNSINHDFTTTDSFYTPDTALNYDYWYWKVRAVDKAGNEAWSSDYNVLDIYQQVIVDPVSIDGYVRDSRTQAGIYGATVSFGINPSSISNTQPGTRSIAPAPTIMASTTTDQDGHYEISGISGEYTFTASASGYGSQSTDVYVPPTGTTRSFSLTSTTSDDDNPIDDDYCFIKGTKISTPSGEKNIDEIQEGDIVLSYNEVTGIIEPNKVTAAYSHPPSEYLLINDKLGVTEEHLIYVNEGLIPAGEIQVGDVLTGIEHNEIVSKIEVILTPLEVYSIEVENNHNYFAEEILVHNAKEDPFPSGGGCPFVYTWDGTEYVKDNNLLPQSTKLTRDSLEVTDYYMLEQELIPQNDTYPIRIYETGYEYSHIDQLQLVTVDYPAGYDVAVTPEGEIITYSNPEYLMTCFDEEGNNQMPGIDYPGDGLTYNGIADDYLTVNLGNMGEITSSNLLIRHSFVPPANEAGWIFEITWINKDSIHIQIQSETGEWVDYAAIPSRVEWSMCAIDLEGIMDYIIEGNDIRLFLTGEHMIDYIGLDVSEPEEVEINVYSPEYVNYVHSEDFDATSKLLNSDGCYVKLAPGEGIQADFPFEPLSNDCRDFILITNGHYYTVGLIDIEQPVTITASIDSDSEGTVSVWLAENYDQETTNILMGYTYDIQDGLDDFYLLFRQEPDNDYSLMVKFDGCDADVSLDLELHSFRGSEVLEFEYVPGGETEQNISLDDTLWKITGVDFNPITGTFFAMKESLIQFKLNDFYDMKTEHWDEASWVFGDGLFTNDMLPTHEYSDYGTYQVDLELVNESVNYMINAWADIDIVPSAPRLDIEVYQETEITLRTTGRKDNTVALQVYEDGELIDEMSVSRIPGNPDAQLSSLTLNKYIDREYEFLLIFDAAHAGENPTWLTFESGDNVEVFYTVFTTCVGGFHQEVPVDAVYLDNVLQSNGQYFFDASASYDLDGAIVSYEWDFGDGSTATGEQAEHTFAGTGIYEVILTVIDDDGIVAQESVSVKFD